ncbi:polycomb complex protein BMI-1-A [Nematostella vectensis]|uniref:polycomb complex protein BMI-1-A n=1 Tax=Nematostella vectensis TaxID=45351 RepID=UPI0020770724|nr:polycomb complex protein BMI-1-A [Nematostella vectensis]XP_032233159.2 polycomb complex protein BMI-1-A [Nematostella vectensis]
MLRRMALKDLNPHIICVLCGGYLVDATTIVECLHSFCRSCIVSWLQASYHCPVCDTEVHKTRPFLNIRPDCVLQDIVYKLVPGLYQRELNYREEFKTKLQENDPTRVEPKDEVKGDSNNKKHEDDVIEDPVCLTLEYYGARRNWRDQPVFPTRYLRCSSTMTIGVLKKFFLMKFSIPPSHEAEIVRSDEILSDHLSMKEVAGIYGLHSKSFIDLQYVFMAIDNDNDPDSKIPRTSLTNSGNTRLMAQISKNSARDTFTKSREKKRTARERKATLRDQHSPSRDVKNAVPRNHSNASEGPNSTSCEENIHLKNTLDPHLLSHKHLHTNESLIDRIGVEPRQDLSLSKYEANGTIPTMVDTFECPDTPESDKQEKFFPGEFSPSGNMEPEISTVVM